MAHALVVFESMFGNTRKVAETVAEGLRSGMSVEIVDVGDAPDHLDGVDLLVVGAPTHAFTLSRPSSRADAVKQGAEAPSRTGLREWLDRIATGADHPPVATFDTKVKRPKLPGSAARAAQKRLRHAGFRPVAGAVSFYVEGTSGPLVTGELARAGEWGRQLSSLVAAPPAR